MLKERKQTVAFAESCTGGLCSKRITDIPGASDVIHFSLVSYTNAVKNKFLVVSEDTLAKYTEVSAETAKEMAEGVRKLSGATYGVSVTGFAGPGNEEEVGTIFICVSSEKQTEVMKLTTGHRGDNCRDYNRFVGASNALNLLRKCISANS